MNDLKQKLIVIFTSPKTYMRLTMFMAIAAFVYSLGFATGFLQMKDYNYNTFYVPAQETNHFLFDTSLLVLVLVLITLKSRVYENPFDHLVNTVVFFATAAVTVVVSVVSLLKAIEIGDLHKVADFDFLFEYVDGYEKTTFQFTICYPIFILLTLTMIATVVTSLIKNSKNKVAKGDGLDG